MEKDKISGVGVPHKTAIAVSNLPELSGRAAGNQTLGVMTAKGDLAVEIGSQRLAEIQEEILWLCEVGHAPVIWATQASEALVKKGASPRRVHPHGEK